MRLRIHSLGRNNVRHPVAAYRENHLLMFSVRYETQECIHQLQFYWPFTNRPLSAYLCKGYLFPSSFLSSHMMYFILSNKILFVNRKFYTLRLPFLSWSFHQNVSACISPFAKIHMCIFYIFLRKHIRKQLRQPCFF